MGRACRRYARRAAASIHGCRDPSAGARPGSRSPVCPGRASSFAITRGITKGVENVALAEVYDDC